MSLRKRIRRRAMAAVLCGLATAIALQLGFGFAAECDPGLRDPAFGDKWAKLKRVTANCHPEYLMLGSSRTLLGFRADGRNFNFGTPAAGPITNAVYWERLKSRGVRPEILLIEVLPAHLADGPNGPIEQQFLIGQRLLSSELEAVEAFGFDPAVIRPAWRDSAICPIFNLRRQTLGRVLPGWLPWDSRFDWSRNTDAFGWATPPRQDVTDAERAELFEKVKVEYRATLEGLNPFGRPLQALKSLIDSARVIGASPVLVLMPEAPSYRALYPMGLRERVRTSLESLAIPLVDASEWLEESDFYDGHHPFQKGAEAFTTRLMREVSRDR